MGATFFGALGKSADDGHVRHIFGISAIGGWDMLQCVKIVAPSVWNAAWIFQVVLVHLFNIRRIAAKEIGVALIGLIDGRCLAHIPLTSAFLWKALVGLETFRDTAEPVGGCDCGWEGPVTGAIVPSNTSAEDTNLVFSAECAK